MSSKENHVMHRRNEVFLYIGSLICLVVAVVLLSGVQSDEDESSKIWIYVSSAMLLIISILLAYLAFFHVRRNYAM
jgi:hypothetical protein